MQHTLGPGNLSEYEWLLWTEIKGHCYSWPISPWHQASQTIILGNGVDYCAKSYHTFSLPIGKMLLYWTLFLSAVLYITVVFLACFGGEFHIYSCPYQDASRWFFFSHFAHRHQTEGHWHNALHNMVITVVLIPCYSSLKCIWEVHDLSSSFIFHSLYNHRLFYKVNLW